MSGSLSLFSACCVFAALIVSVRCFDFTGAGISCDISISSLTNFQSFLSSSGSSGISGHWTGSKNVCFQPGLYNITQISGSYQINSSQNWYGPQFSSDPTCAGGNYNPTCTRLTSATSFDSSTEAVLIFNPKNTVTANVFVVNKNFSLNGFSMTLKTNPDYGFVTNAFITVQNNYILTLSSSGAGFHLLAGFYLSSNYFDGFYLSPSSQPIQIASNGVVSDNFFNTHYGSYTTSGTVTVIGNTFINGQYQINILTGSHYIYNNTFIATGDISIFIGGSGTNIVDSNLFVLAVAGNYVYNDGTGQVNITNNIFAGPTMYGSITDNNPYYLAYNDFIDCGFYLFGSTWDVSDAHVYNNYCGPDGVYEMPDENPVGNTMVQTFYAKTESPSIFPYTLTPNHPNLPSTMVQNVSWTLINNSNSRPYFIVGDQINITWTYQAPEWYDQFNIPNSVYSTTANVVLFGSANVNPSYIATEITNKYGQENSYLYTPTPSQLTPQGAQYGYFLSVQVFENNWATFPAKSIFLQQPLNISLSTLPSNGYYYSNQVITAKIFTDASIHNITLSLRSNVRSHSHDFLFLANGTNIEESYVIPVNLVGNNTEWQLTAIFYLPSGENWVIADSNVFGFKTLKPPLSCYNETITVDKGLRKVNPIQTFTLQDFGCNTTDWEIVGVNSTTLYSYSNNSVVLNISSSFSGTRPVHYQISQVSSGTIVHNVITHVNIENHSPVINNSTFTWTYPRTTQTFPTWNLLTGCTDQDGDSLSVVQIAKTNSRTPNTIVQYDSFTILFVPEKALLQVTPTGQITLSTPSTTPPGTAGSPLPLFWNKDLSFQFEVTDGDVTNSNTWGTAQINSV